MFNLYDKDVKNVGYIIFSSNSRTMTTENVNYQNYQCGIFLNNNKNLLSICYNEVTGSVGLSYSDTETLVKAVYGGGKYQGKDVTVSIKYLKNNKRKVTITSC
jgi:hypothetical protein